MILVFYNPLGAVMCMTPAFLLSLGLVYLPRPSETWVAVGAWGLLACIWDALYRTFNQDAGEDWLHTERGGQVFFIPVCFFGLAAFAWYVHHALAVGYFLPHTVPDPHSFSGNP